MISLALEIARRKRLGHVFLGLDPSGRAIFTARIPVTRVTHRPSVLEILRDQRGTVGTYYSSASDGYIGSDHAVYATARSGNNFVVSTTLYVGQNYNEADFNCYIWRGHLYTDTSTIGADADITAASLFVYVQTDYSTTDFNLTAVASTASDPPTASQANWDAIGATSFGSVSTVGISTTAYTEIVLNASGIANINKTAATQWGLRSSRDISATAPTGYERINFYASEQTGTDKDPYLSVTYTTPTYKSVADTCTFTDAIGNITVSFTVADAVTATDAIGALTRTSTGKLYGLDDFSTGAFATLTNNWTVPIGTVAIEAGELSLAASGGGTVGQLRTIATYTDQVWSLRLKRDTATYDRFYLRFYTSGGMYAYTVEFTATQAVLRKAVNAAWTTLLWPVIVCDAATWYNAKISIIGTAIKVWFDGSLVINTTDPDVPGAGQMVLYAYHATPNTAHSHMDNVGISNANSITVSGLPTGWDAVCGGVTATEVGGTATLDMADVAFPQANISIRDASDTVMFTLTPSDGVWGGDVLQHRGIEARVTVADTMTATDSPAITAYVTVADGITATDGLQITVNVTVADAVTAADVVAYLEKLYPHIVNLQSGTFIVKLQSGKFIVNLQSGTGTVT
jgi:hypothetical protein